MKVKNLLKLEYANYHILNKINMLKAIIIFLAQLTYFIVVCVPLALTLLLTAHLFFELKRIIKWIKK
jgi:hypothetical protein